MNNPVEAQDDLITVPIAAVYLDNGQVSFDMAAISSTTPEIARLVAQPFVVTVSPDPGDLLIMTPEAWEELRSTVSGLPSLNKDARTIKERVLSYAKQLPPGAPVTINRDLLDDSAADRQFELQVINEGCAKIRVTKSTA